MNLFELSAKITLDDTEYAKKLKEASKDSNALKSSVISVEDQFDQLKNKLSELSTKYNDTAARVKSLNAAYKESAERTGENSEETKNISAQLEKAKSQLSSTENSAKKYAKQLSELVKENNKADDSTDDLAKEIKEAGDESKKAEAKIDDVAEEIKEAGDESEKSSGKFGKFSSALGNGLKVAAGIGVAAVTAASAAVVALTKEAVENYAEYEQLVGGVETLFKESSEKVQEYAANAYKTAGLSANEYMNTVTSFSASLLQSLEGDTGKAAEYAQQAITDMADNANKMGTDISMIQNAYQGFAKKNYTMLDNLKLGYGGTQQEMFRLMQDAEKLGAKFNSEFYLTEKGSLVADFADITEAIHVIQTEMGITGTTAKEASETISGSVASMKSAWSNLLTGIADDNADMETLINNFVDSVGIAAENIIPRIEVALDGTGQLIDTMFPILLDKVPDTISKYLPKLTESAVGMIQTLVDGLKDDENQQKIGKAAKDTITTLVNGAKDLLPDLLDLGVDLVISLASGIGEGAPTMIPEAVNLVMDLVEGLTSPESISGLLGAAGDLIQGLLIGLLDGGKAMRKRMPDIIDNIGDGLEDAIPDLIDTAFEIIDSLFDYMTDPESLNNSLNVAAAIIRAIAKGLISAGTALYENGKELFEEFKDGFLDFKSDPKKWGKDLIDNFIGGIKDGWKNLKNSVTDVAQSIKDLIGFSEPKEGPLSNFHTYAPDMMDLFAQGVRENEHVVTDQIEKSFDFGKRTIEAAYTVTGDAAYSGHTVSGSYSPSVVININGADHIDARTLAQEAAEAVSRALQQLTDRRAAAYA